MTAPSLPAVVRLMDTDVIPDGGLRELSLRVNLTSDIKMRTAWPSEITISGETPWYRGEERLVELRIKAKPFNDYVTCWRPKLYVCRNDKIIGSLTLADLEPRSEEDAG